MQILIGGLVAATALAATAVGVQNRSASAETVSTANRAQIEQIVREYILEHPEILPEAMERLQAKRVGTAIDEKRAQIETPYRGAWEGAENGDVVLVEFFDYACGYCRSSLPDITRLLAEDKKLKVVYRELPILSEESNKAAHVSLLAAEQGKYSVFHKALYDSGRVTEESILASAVSAGIDRKAAQKAMADDSYATEIDGNIKLAQALGASGTPTFIVGDKVLSGAVGYDALKKAIAAVRSKE